MKPAKLTVTDEQILALIEACECQITRWEDIAKKYPLSPQDQRSWEIITATYDMLKAVHSGRRLVRRALDLPTKTV